MSQQSKGKGRATETTPLLAGAASSSDVESEAPPPRRSALKSVFLVSLCLAVIIAALLALLAWSYASQVSTSSDDLINSSLVVRGPDNVQLLNVTSNGGMWLRLSARLGFDAGAVLHVHDSRQSDGFFTLVWKSLGRWGIRQMDSVSVLLDPFQLQSLHQHPSPSLASISASPIQVPLTADPPPDLSWLTPASVDVLIAPTTKTEDLWDFLRDSWASGSLMIGAAVPKVFIHGGPLSDSSWRSLFKKSLVDLQVAFGIPFDPLPGMPPPGKNVPFPAIADLISLESFSISSNGSSLALSGAASIVNPAPTTLNFTAPSIPFTISLPTDQDGGSVPIASAKSLPFALTYPNISVQIAGHLLPISATPSSRKALANFLGRFLSAKNNDIIISTPLFPALPPVPALFPALSPPPNVLRHVTIRDMKFTPVTERNGETIFYASGTVNAHVILPQGFDVSIAVHHILPDVIVFDGEVPIKVEPLGFPSSHDEDDMPAPPAPPLPDPIPEHAFGRIRPKNWLRSVSWADQDDNSGEGSAYVVEARIDKIPMDILPGREDEFSKFVQKVIFGSDGAIAGMLGHAGVKVQVKGLPVHDDKGKTPDMELSGLPFRGAVRVGRKRIAPPSLDSYWEHPYELDAIAS